MAIGLNVPIEFLIAREAAFDGFPCERILAWVIRNLLPHIRLTQHASAAIVAYTSGLATGECVMATTNTKTVRLSLRKDRTIVVPTGRWLGASQHQAFLSAKHS